MKFLFCIFFIVQLIFGFTGTSAQEKNETSSPFVESTYNKFYTIGDHSIDSSISVQIFVDNEKIRFEFEQIFPSPNTIIQNNSHYTRDGNFISINKDPTFFQVFLRFKSQKGYYQFAINQYNTQFDQYNRSASFQSIKDDFNWFSSVSIIDKHHWKCEIEIPWESLFQRANIKPGTNFSKSRKKTRMGKQRRTKSFIPFQDEKPTSIREQVYFNISSVIIEDSISIPISLAPLTENLHEMGNFLPLIMPWNFNIKPYSGNLTPRYLQILEQLIQYDGKIADRRRSLRDLRIAIQQDISLDGFYQIFEKYKTDDIPPDVLKLVLRNPKSFIPNFQTNEYVTFLKKLSESTKAPKQKIAIIDIMNRWKSKNISETRTKLSQQKSTNSEIMPLYYLGLITKEFSTETNILKFGTLVFPTESPEKIDAIIEQNGYGRVLVHNKEISCKTVDGQKVIIPGTHLLLFPAVGKFLADTMSLFSRNDTLFQFSKKIKISPFQTLPVTGFHEESGGKTWYQLTSTLIGQYGETWTAWVQADNFVLDTSFVYVDAVSEPFHTNGSPWDFLKNPEQLAQLYQLSIEGRDIHNPDLIRMAFQYKTKLIQFKNYKQAEEILLQFIQDDTDLPRQERDEFSTANFPAAISSRFSLIELYGKYLKDFDKLENIVIQLVKEFPGYKISGFEWNSFVDYSSVSRVIKYLKKNNHYFEFLNKLLDVSTFNFTRTYIQLLKGDYYLDRSDYLNALNEYKKIIVESPTETKHFFKTGVNHHSEAMGRFIWTNLVMGNQSEQIHKELFSLIPDHSDSAKYEIGFQKMIATYGPRNPVIYTPAEKNNNRNLRFQFGNFHSKIPGGITINWQNVFRNSTVIDTTLPLKSLPIESSKTLMTFVPGQKVITFFPGQIPTEFKGWNKVKVSDKDQYGWIKTDKIIKIQTPKISTGFLYRFSRGSEPKNVAFIQDGQIIHKTEMIPPPKNIRGDRSTYYFLTPDDTVKKNPNILSLHYNNEEELALFDTLNHQKKIGVLPNDFFTLLKQKFSNKESKILKVEKLYKNVKSKIDKTALKINPDSKIKHVLQVYQGDFDGDGKNNWIIEVRDGETFEEYLIFSLHGDLKILQDSKILQSFGLNSIHHFMVQSSNRRGQKCFNVYASYPNTIKRVYSDNCVNN
ncbi:MAG: hypothetical protein HOB40_04015 [Candidatus Marinimicrobia bacterium]|jgi:tetratricopeptide (TPR) repeat protein|nr:hypothetical protein [Candidatus Neomarinimicrobiota bacterium]MBT3500711.1 hypothetical protein [Candidatus Neomarinimicrobiota bacterium]MBT3839559.1 hypothetical protein [Candidatus Neomarinimicrobiota bacterium]MBT3998911.1 hypothetical protein [Candidatus Neomarinimicrobiota bacterium]MBT4283148.1 hypothetical protein [Candidatus Neomarinimicrobiota bacterium]